MMPTDSTYRPRFFFVHIPKCAGTSVLDSLCRVGRQHYIILSGSPESKSQATADLQGEMAKRGRHVGRIDLVMGHDVFYGLHQVFEFDDTNSPQQLSREITNRPAAYFTFLRDPTARYISHYRYLVDCANDRNSTLHDFAKNKVAPEGKVLSLSQYADRGCYANLMTNYLAAANDPDLETRRWQINDRDRLLELAISFLDQMFFIGFVESISDDLRFLCTQIGLSEKTKTVNRSKSGIDDQISQPLLDEIRTLNDLDVQIYAHAKSLRQKTTGQPS